MSNKKGTKHPKLKSSSNEEENKESDWKCHMCDSESTKESDCICQCDFCEKYFCAECLDMDRSDYEHLSKSPGKWFCPPCNVKMNKLIRDTKTVEEKCEEFLSKFAKKLEKLEEDVEQIKQATKKQEKIMKQVEKDVRSKCDKAAVNQMIEEKITQAESANGDLGSGANAMQTQINNKCTEAEVKKIIKEAQKATDKESGDGNVSEQVDIAVKELSDRKSRENNIIIFNVPEPKTVMKADRLAKDSANFKILLDHVGMTNSIDTYIDEETIRFGEKSTTKSRPLQIKFKENKDKQEFMQSLSKLRTLADTSDLKKITIINDMTRLERDNEKKLVDEMKMKNEAQPQGEYCFRVRGPPWDRKVVEIRKKKE